MSALKKTDSPPLEEITSLVVFPRSVSYPWAFASSRKSQQAILAPSAAKPSEIDRPTNSRSAESYLRFVKSFVLPDEPPVTIATFPTSFPVIFSLAF